MRPKAKILVGIVIYNEESKLKDLLLKIHNTLNTSNYFFIFINDHSTDNSPHILNKFIKQNKKCKLINNKKNSGVGKSIKNVIS